MASAKVVYFLFKFIATPNFRILHKVVIVLLPPQKFVWLPCWLLLKQVEVVSSDMMSTTVSRKSIHLFKQIIYEDRHAWTNRQTWWHS